MTGGASRRMRKRPKRDLRKRWQLGEEAAEEADAAACSSDADAEDERLLILDHVRLWEILTRYGIPQLGRARLKKLGVEAIQLRRLNPAEDLPRWIRDRARVSSTKTPAETVSSRLLAQLVQGIDDEPRREQGRREIAGWVIEVREQTLLRHAKAWVRRHTGAKIPAEPRVPRFANEQNRALVFDPMDSEVVWRLKEAEYRALSRRVDEVMSARSHSTVGEGIARVTLMDWRTFAPLLQWEESGFTERHWSELTDDELRRFVQAGDERENILANREDDLTRVRGALRDRRPPPRSTEGQVSGRRTPEDDAWDDLERRGAAAIRQPVSEAAQAKPKRRGPSARGKQDS